MPIKGMFWIKEAERDVHVLLGEQSRALIDGLRFLKADANDIEAKDYLAQPDADVTLEFRPRLKPTGPDAGDLIPCHGVQVNRKTGAVTAAKPAPASHRRHNFIIEAVATHTPAAGGKALSPLPVRVHLHQSITQLWLSPPTLTLRQGVPNNELPESTAFRFSVRAKFDDGTVGDLTAHHGVKWAGGTDNVDDEGRLAIDKGNAPGTTVTITATLPPALGGGSASGTVHFAQPWASLSTPPKAEIVVGGAWPGTINPEAVPNILLLGDGFTAGDAKFFDQVVTAAVGHLKNSRFARPFDLLSTSMNFWRVLPPPGGGGVSFRCEFYTFTDNGVLTAFPLPAARRPVEGGAQWVSANLLYEVGLPVPADVGRTNAALLDEWDAVIGPGPRAHAPDHAITRWKEMGNRVFMEEVDAFPGMAYGNPPAAELEAEQKDTPWIKLHPDRGGGEGLDRFLEVLQSTNGVALSGGVPLGQVWVNPRLDTVVLLNRYGGGRASAGLHVYMGTRSNNYRTPVVPIAGRGELAVAPAPPPDPGEEGKTAPFYASIARTLAHELGHRLGLGDEYVEKAESYPDGEGALKFVGNLQTEAAVPLSPGALKVGDIKWDWHRVRKAAVLTGPAAAAGAGRFRLPVRPGDAYPFEPGNVLLLRKREAHRVLTTRPPVLDRHLRVAEKPAKPGDAVVVEAAPGFTLSLADLAPYGDGSLLFLPVASKVDAEVHARLVAHDVRAHIAAKGPLTGSPCKPQIGGGVQTPGLEGVDLPWCFRHRPRVVGLYHGGDQYACGIFHPTGSCMMRNGRSPEAEFCAVCRYVLVDLVNPSRHWEIDHDYEEIYPQT